jgi:DNA-binding NtrC family response regulator
MASLCGYRPKEERNMDSLLQRDEGNDLRLEEIERRARGANGDAALRLRDWLALAEAWRIAQALHDARGNRSAAARTLGIGRRTLYTKIDKLGLVPAWRVARAGASGDLRLPRAAAGD